MAGILLPTASDGRYRRARRQGENEPETMCRADLGYRSRPTTSRGFANLSLSTPQPDLLRSAAACRASSLPLSAEVTAFRGTRARLEAPPAIVSTATARSDMSTGTFGSSANVFAAATRVRCASASILGAPMPRSYHSATALFRSTLAHSGAGAAKKESMSGGKKSPPVPCLWPSSLGKSLATPSTPRGFLRSPVGWPFIP